MISQNSAAGDKSHRVCLVRQDYYLNDARLENQAQALLESGFAVDLICVRRCGEPITSRSNGIRIIRLPALHRSRGGLYLYALEYLSFWLVTFIALSFLHLWRRYALIQICNLPDFLVFAALVPKLMGCKILLDFRECMPEMYAAKYGVGRESRFFLRLAQLEQACVRFADGAVTCTEQMRKTTMGRGTPAEKIFVMMNSVNPANFSAKFSSEPKSVQNLTFNILTHGSIIPRYGHEVLIRAVNIVRSDIPHIRLLILGEGQQKNELENLVRSLDLDDFVRFGGYIPFDELVDRLCWADVGAVTMVRNEETDLIHTIKMQEYMVMGVPVVISRTSAVEAYFDSDCVQFFEADNPNDLAHKLLELYDSPRYRNRLAANALEKCSRVYSVAEQKTIFAATVRRLIEQRHIRRNFVQKTVER